MWTNVDERIRRALNGVRSAFRGVLNHTNSAGPLQASQLTGLAGEQLQDVELMQHYGYTSRPPAGTVAVAVPVGGRTSHAVIVATEHPGFRLQALENGEVAVYTDEGARIVLKRGRLIEVECDVFRLKCKEYELTAEQKATTTAPEIALAASSQLGLNTPSISAGSTDGGATTMDFNGTIQATDDIKAGSVSVINHDHPDAHGGNTGKPNT